MGIGYLVSIFERPKAPEFNRAISGSILQRRDLEATFEDADTVIHTAAIVEESGDIERFFRLNVDGARLAAEVARDSGERRFIHLSSVMVYGFDFPNQVSESVPLWPNGNPYCDSKIASEDAVSALETDTFRVIIARPGDVVGPGSVPWVTRPSTSCAVSSLPLPSGWPWPPQSYSRPGHRTGTSSLNPAWRSRQSLQFGDW